MPKQVIVLFLLFLTLLSLSSFSYAAPQSVTLPASPVPESNDFATMVLHDPWDMNEYSDISQYINESGERDVVRNIQFSGGIFSATSAGNVLGDEQQNGWFFTLFPGYETAIHTGRSGSKTPILSSDYRCIYIAMKVDSPAANEFGPDQFRVFWFGDDRLNTQGAPYGLTTGIALYPEYGAAQPVPVWKLYKLDLVTTPAPSGFSGIVAWNAHPTWQGIRIDPTINANINYAVDWVRLTNCDPNIVNITFSPSSAINSVWLRPQGTSQYIRVQTDVDGNSGFYGLDIQGVQPGSYHVGFGDLETCCVEESTQVLKINQTPLATYTNPTFYSGEDFSTQAGNPWDMSSEQDYFGIRCAQYGQGDGYLWIQTPPNTSQPEECRGSDPQAVSDPSIYLDVPAPINPAEYRYLSFRMYDDNQWQFVAQGSMNRWVWTVQGDSGRPGYECHLVSQDMPFDVGWNIYTIDLWDSFEGSAEAWQGLAHDGVDECDSLPKNWLQSGAILRARFDPNENITDHTYYNELDWVRLTKPIVVKRGSIYTISLNKFFAGDTFDTTLFYTTDRNQPMQNPLAVYSPPPLPPVLGPNVIYMPLIRKDSDPFIQPGDLNFRWDTTTVNPGEYYICSVVNDGLNQATICSEATITITN